MSDINTELPDYELTKTNASSIDEDDIYNAEGIEVNCPQNIYEHRDDAEYGKTEHITYYSKTTECERGAVILFPVNYTTSKKYPVVYLQHGIFGDEYCMINDVNNHIADIIGNMAADGLAREVILVATNMYATGDKKLAPAFNAEAVAPYDNFINDLVNDLMPYMEANYPVLTGRENTGVVGFSMGGRESLFIGMSRSDLFGFTGGISPAPGLTPAKDWAMEHAGQWTEDELTVKCSEKPNLLMVVCGDSDKVVGSFPKSYHEIMMKNQVEHLWYEVPGADHDNKAIRSGLYNFMLRFKSY